MLSKCMFPCIKRAVQLNTAAAISKSGIFSISRNFKMTRRFQSNGQKTFKEIADAESAIRGRSIAYYSISAVVMTVGLTYAAVPLYRMFCQSTGFGGTLDITQDDNKVGEMKRIENTVLKIRFNADIGSSMRWNFKPQQYEIKVVPGETALAFYKARNPTDEPVVGISTYNVIPFEAGQYFNKIQCFCFEAQQLNPHEEVDMPVFFYIDPEFVNDPKMEFVDVIILSYTFFELKDGMSLPMPSYARTH